MTNNSKKIQTHRIKKTLHSMRLVDYCGDVFPMLGSKSATKKAIASGRLEHNGKKATGSEFLRKGDVLKLKGSGIQKVKQFLVDFDIVFEDDSFMVINKPAGIAVNGNRFKTVENAVVGKFKNSKEKDALPRPIAVHRLDVPTKGLVILAKTKSALIHFGKAFQNNRISKSYCAVVHGKLEKKLRIDLPIDGKESATLVEPNRVVPSRVYQHLSLLILKPITGRTHQLRIHLAKNGHLIVGDKMYAEGKNTLLGKGLYLAAIKLEFQHPKTQKQIEISLPIPAKFMKLVDREAERFS